METLTGDFETHLTMKLGTAAEEARLGVWAEQHGLKLTHIVLERGETPSQLMLTQQSHGRFSEVLAWAEQRRDQLQAAGFVVTRLKLEAAPWNAGIPRTDDEARLLPATYHFEHHVKLLLDAETALDLVVVLVERHGAHLSRNARRTRSDGKHERFVTQRCYGVGQESARQRLATLRGVLQPYTIVDTEEELVVYDSNGALDRGWLVPSERSHAL